MKFDLDAARRGEPVEVLISIEWRPAHFVGINVDGNPVVQIGRNYPLIVSKESLRMAPKPPRKMWVQVFRNGADMIVCSNPHESPEEAIGSARWHQLIGEPQQILVAGE